MFWVLLSITNTSKTEIIVIVIIIKKHSELNKTKEFSHRIFLISFFSNLKTT